MGTKRDSRQAKSRLKHRQKREVARRTRGSRAVAGQVSESLDSLREAARWPLADCYLSEGWYEQGAQVHAVFVRAAADGRAAAAFFEVDLADRGIVSVRALAGVSLPAIQGELATLSEGGKPLLVVPPALVVKLVREAERHGAANGHGPAEGVGRATLIFAGVDPADAPEEILLGAPEPEGPAPARGGLIAGLRRRLGLG